MKSVLAAVLPLLLCSCVMSTKPTGDEGFASAADLHAFEGCFANVGETGDAGGVHLLSVVIWPRTDLDHGSVDVVKVEVDQIDTLHVSAIGAGRVVRDDRFLEGRDFVVVDGRIQLKSRATGSAATEGGNPFMGVATESTILGIDKFGNGRVVQSTNIAGTGFLVVPIIGHISDTIRFKKLTACSGS